LGFFNFFTTASKWRSNFESC